MGRNPVGVEIDHIAKRAIQIGPAQRRSAESAAIRRDRGYVSAIINGDDGYLTLKPSRAIGSQYDIVGRPSWQGGDPSLIGNAALNNRRNIASIEGDGIQCADFDARISHEATNPLS